MDPTQEAQPQQPPVVQPTSQPVISTTTPPPQGPNKLLLLAAMLLAVVLIALGAFYYMRMTQNTADVDTQVLPTLASPPPESEVTPTAAELDTQSDVEAVDIGSAESDLQDIQTDLEAL